MNLILTGYRGTGKSSTAKELSKMLKIKEVSSDEAVEKKQGMNIEEIVKKFGWSEFRKIEKEVIKDISEQDNMIVDCGGGVVLDEENVKNLKKKGKIILLLASVQTIRNRIKDSKLPALTEKNYLDEVEDVLEKRKPFYSKAADLAIDTENSTPKEVANKIKKAIDYGVL